MNALTEQITENIYEEIKCRRVWHGMLAEQRHDDVYRAGIRMGVIAALDEIQRRFPDVHFRID